MWNEISYIFKIKVKYITYQLAKDDFSGIKIWLFKKKIDFVNYLTISDNPRASLLKSIYY